MLQGWQQVGGCGGRQWAWHKGSHGLLTSAGGDREEGGVEDTNLSSFLGWSEEGAVATLEAGPGPSL